MWQAGGVALAVTLATAGCASSGGSGTASRRVRAESIWSTTVDVHNLPSGDGKYSSTKKKKGSIYTCQSSFSGGGAFATGSWVHANGTWDKTAKPQVDGSVTWPYSFSISTSGTQRVFTFNDLPKHPTGTFPISPSDDAYQYDRNPNSITAHSLSIQVPLNPVLSKKQCVRGEVGIMLSGALLFDGLDAGGRDAVEHEIQDSCGGHPQSGGLYHYHDLSACVSDPYTGGQSALLGYALDGFGIYGKYDANGKVLTNADLDSCHGRKSKVMWNGQLTKIYHYVMTTEYPYSVGCFRGSQVAVVPQH
jgi:hypothetical protein